MKFNQVGVVYKKELTDIIRDRRTLVSMILLPIFLIPALTFGLGGMVGKQIKKIEEKSFTIAVLGADNAPGLHSYLDRNRQFGLIDLGNDSSMAIELLEEKTVLSIISFPSNFENNLTSFFKGGSDAPELIITSDEAEIESEIAGDKLRDAVYEYQRELVSAELKKLNLRGDLTTPFTITSINAATDSKMGGYAAGQMLPFLLILMTITGAMYPAIDLTF